MKARLSIVASGWLKLPTGGFKPQFDKLTKGKTNMRNENTPEVTKRTVTFSVIGVVVFFVALISFFGSFAIVEKGHVGVKQRWGAVTGEALTPGWHWKIPFADSVEDMSTKMISYGVDAGAASSDLQSVTTRISVQHYLVAEKGPDALQNVGDIKAIDATVVDPAILESLKAVTARYTAEQLVTKRDEVKARVTQEIRRYITSTLREKGIDGALHIANVAIEDFEFSDEFNESIESKVKAEQDALRAENDKVKRITEAEAEARERELQADAESYRIDVTSKARADAIAREAAALSGHPELIELRLTEQWDGKLPRYSNGTDLPFIGNPGDGR